MGLVVNKNSSAYAAISSLKSGNSVLFYDVNPLMAVIVTPISAIDEEAALHYASNFGYIIFSKEKVNSLYRIMSTQNLTLLLNKVNVHDILREIKHSFTSQESYSQSDHNFSVADNIDNMAIMIAKEAEEIPVLFACNLNLSNLDDILSFALKNSIYAISSQQCVQHKSNFSLTHLSTSKLVLRDMGEVSLYLYKDLIKHHCVIVKNNSDLALWQNPIVRVHSSCYTGDVLGSMFCDCHDQLHKSMQLIAKDPEGGMIIYLNQEGRNIGLGNKLKAYYLQNECGMDTVEANHVLGFDDDERDFTIALEILKCFNVKKMRLITNNPSKVRCMSRSGAVLEDVPIITAINLYNKGYLETKVKKMGHKISTCV